MYESVRPLIVFVAMLMVVESVLLQFKPVNVMVLTAQAASALKDDCFSYIQNPDGTVKPVGEDITINAQGKEISSKPDPKEPPGKCKVQYTGADGSTHVVDDIKANDISKIIGQQGSNAPFSASYYEYPYGSPVSSETTGSTRGESGYINSSSYSINAVDSLQKNLDEINQELSGASAQAMSTEKFNDLISQRDQMESMISDMSQSLPSEMNATGASTFGAPSSGFIGNPPDDFSPDTSNARLLVPEESARFDVTSNPNVMYGQFGTPQATGFLPTSESGSIVGSTLPTNTFDQRFEGAPVQGVEIQSWMFEMADMPPMPELPPDIYDGNYYEPLNHLPSWPTNALVNEFSPGRPDFPTLDSFSQTPQWIDSNLVNEFTQNMNPYLLPKGDHSLGWNWKEYGTWDPSFNSVSAQNYLPAVDTSIQGDVYSDLPQSQNIDDRRGESVGSSYWGKISSWFSNLF